MTAPINKRSVCERVPMGDGLACVEGDAGVAWLTVMTTPKLGIMVVFVLRVCVGV
jgi:hypothetical protein